MKEIIAFSSFPDYSGNCKALFEDMNKVDCKYDLVWFCKEKEVAEKLNKFGIKAIYDKDENFLDEFNKVKIMINTHDDYIMLKNDNQIFINLWHGLGPKKMGTFVDKETEWLYNFSTKTDYVVAASEFGRVTFTAVFNKPMEHIKQFSQPRYKWLFENKGRKNLENILQKDLKKYKKIIMYAPTFKKGIGKEDATFNEENLLNLKLYDENILTDYLEKNNILLILKLHPVEENQIKEVKSNNIIKLNDEVMLENFITINEILDGIDLLISDYSSIYIDYINLERPVIFLDTDKVEYEKNRGIIFNSLDFWWSAGPKVHSIEDFTEEVDKLLSDDEYFKMQRKQFNKLVNGEIDKTNKGLIEFIEKIDKELVDKNNNNDISLLEKNNKLLKEQIIQIKNNCKEQINKYIEKNELKQSEINNLNCEIRYVRKEYEKVYKELESIKYSRSYKMIKRIKKIINKK